MDSASLSASIGAALTRAEAQVKGLTDPTELSVLHEATTDLIVSMERRIVRAKALRDLITARMEANMGDGEAIVCPSTGRVAYIGQLSDGKATVVAEAVNEMGDHLHEPLRPRTYTRYPTVTDLRNALRSGDITRQVFDELVSQPGTRVGLRWRTIDIEDAA